VIRGARASRRSRLRVWITGGGTREPLDDVRWIGNVSTGRMALALAAEARRRGHQVTLFLAEHVPAPRTSAIELVRFVTAADLRRELLRPRPAPAAILHAAAVSDYAPRPLPGKKRSGGPRWRIVLEPLPKVASAARRRWPLAFLVLFKLEARISLRRLLERARRAARSAGAEAVFANRLEEVGREHRGWLVDMKRGAATPATTRRGAARLLVRACEVAGSARGRGGATR
jgi:phosphopantothenoylcysteine decarboxylase/phosphopantothenate--cysteine ligase